jgi:long-chain acyl-CoA synthetase
VKGNAVAIWGENRAEWIIVLWGCLLEGVVLVPIDYRASVEFVTRISTIVDARAVVVGDAVAADALGSERPLWRMADLRPTADRVASGFSLKDSDDFRLKAEATGSVRTRRRLTTPPDHLHLWRDIGAKGVVITHRNILRQHRPHRARDGEVQECAKPFLPIRFLNLLPLSHMFGQAMATFVPPMLPGVVVFMRSYAPEDIVREIHDRRVSVLVCVPKMLEVLRDHVLRVAPEAAHAPVEKTHWLKRWWMFRRIHRMFGFKFWAMVVGAAPLDPELEAFWGRLGFLVVQGYGLTETAPIVTLNHPLQAARGAVGKPIAGVEVRIADDGEILVRGENVTRGYYNAPEETARHSATAGSTPATSASSTRRDSCTSAAERRKYRDARRAQRVSGGRRTGTERCARREGLRGRRGTARRIHGGTGAGGPRARPRDRGGRRRPRCERPAARPPEDPHRRGVVCGRASADRRHTEAEKARATGVAP